MTLVTVVAFERKTGTGKRIKVRKPGESRICGRREKSGERDCARDVKSFSIGFDEGI